MGVYVKRGPVLTKAQCATCGKDFEYLWVRRPARYCSEECRPHRIARPAKDAQRYAQEPRVKKLCEDCGCDIFPKKSNATATMICKKCVIRRSVDTAPTRRKNIFCCATCRKSFWAKGHRARYPSRFCSSRCAGDWRRANPLVFVGPPKPSTCIVCRKRFRPNRRDGKAHGRRPCCSQMCRAEYLKARFGESLASANRCLICKKSISKRGYCGALCRKRGIRRRERKLGREKISNEYVKRQLVQSGPLKGVSYRRIPPGLIEAHRARIRLVREINRRSEL